MRLALDTSTNACSVALRIEGRLYSRHEVQPREHTRLLMPMIRGVLDEAGVGVSDLDSIVLGNGPGSFIGLRIAASVAQGLAFGAGLNIIPVSSLAAVAAEVFSETDAEVVAVTQDAHMSEVYLGVYRRGKGGLPNVAFDERLQTISTIRELAEYSSRTTAIAGDGWHCYPALAAANAGHFSGRSAFLHPRAAYLLSMSDQCSALPPAEIEPAYLRKKVAEKPR